MQWCFVVVTEHFHDPRMSTLVIQGAGRALYKERLAAEAVGIHESRRGQAGPDRIRAVHVVSYIRAHG